jgi:hypothetical protein
MKQLIAVAAAALIAVSVLASSAGAASPTLKSLQAQVTSLRKELARTKKQVKKLQKDVVTARDSGIAGQAVAFCGLAVTADAFQGTWATINQLAAATKQPSIYPAQTPVNDFGLCAQGLRVARSQSVPPTVSAFNAILNLLNGRVAPFAAPWWQPLAS